MDMVIKEQLGNMHVGVPGFYNRFLGCVAGLEEAFEIIYKKCTEGSSPRFSKGGGGWSGWPQDPSEEKVLNWLGELVVELAVFAQAYKSPPALRVLAATPNRGIRGSIAIRKMDVAFVEGPGACDYHWKQVFVLGELKHNPDKE